MAILTADVINLRRARKGKARRAAEVAAQANRVAFGTPKRERERATVEEERRTGRHEAHRREPPEPPRDET